MTFLDKFKNIVDDLESENPWGIFPDDNEYNDLDFKTKVDSVIKDNRTKKAYNVLKMDKEVDPMKVIADKNINDEKDLLNAFLDAIPDKDDYSFFESVTKDKKVSVMEALTEQDIEELSKFSLTDEEIAHILSLFELISDENKDKAFSIIKVLFEGKKLVPDEDKIEESIVTKKRTSVSERYTRMLLGDK